MSRWKVEIKAVIAGLAVLALPATLAAEEWSEFELPTQPGADTVATAPVAGPGAGSAGSDDGFTLHLGGGLKGGVSGVAGYGFNNSESVTDENGNEIPSGGGQWPYPEYYGHGGMGGGAGLAVDLRAMGFVGLEVGYYMSQDNASGYVDKNHAQSGTTIARIHSEQKTRAHHIPMMLKLNIDAEYVRPFIGGGVQIIRQTHSVLEYTQEERGGSYGNESHMEELNERNQIEESTYAQYLAAAGVELSFGIVKIPIELRAGYTIGFDEAMEERARGEDGRIIYDGVYMTHFGIYTGAMVEFDLFRFF